MKFTTQPGYAISTLYLLIHQPNGRSSHQVTFKSKKGLTVSDMLIGLERSKGHDSNSRMLRIQSQSPTMKSVYK